MTRMINKEFLEQLLLQAADNPRKRVNYDMRTSPEDGSQRMLNAMQPGTEVAVHRHPNSDENVLAIEGRLDVILLEKDPLVHGEGCMVHGSGLKEIERFHLCPKEGRYGCQVPKGVWHTVEVIEPSVIYEAKDGKYGEDGSEMYSDV